MGNMVSDHPILNKHGSPMLSRLSRALTVLALLPALAHSYIYKPVLNTQTGRPDLVTPLSTSTIQAGTNVTVSTNSDGSITIGSSGGGSGPNGQINTSAQNNVGFYSVVGTSNVISGNSAFTFNGTTVTLPNPTVFSGLSSTLIAVNLAGAAISTSAAPTSGSLNYIQNRASLQSGATFYVSSGTVNGKLTAGSIADTGLTANALLYANGTALISSDPNILLETAGTVGPGGTALTHLGLSVNPANAAEYGISSVLDDGFAGVTSTQAAGIFVAQGSPHVGYALYADANSNATNYGLYVNNGLVRIPITNSVLATNSLGVIVSTTVSSAGGPTLVATQTWTGQNNWVTPAQSSFTYGLYAGSVTIGGAGTGSFQLTEGADASAFTPASGKDNFWASSSSHSLVTNFNGSTSTGTIIVSTQVATVGNCAKFGSQGSIVDAGAACGSGGGSGTVNSGTANQAAYYASAGTTVSGTSNIQVWTSSITVSTTTVTSSAPLVMLGPTPANFFKQSLTDTLVTLEYFQSGVGDNTLTWASAPGGMTLSSAFANTGAGNTIKSNGALLSVASGAGSLTDAGILDLWGASGKPQYISFNEQSVSNNGYFGFGAGSTAFVWGTGSETFGSGTERMRLSPTGGLTVQSSMTAVGVGKFASIVSTSAAVSINGVAYTFPSGVGAGGAFNVNTSSVITVTAAGTGDMILASTQVASAGKTWQSSSTFNGAVVISTSINAGGTGTSGQFLTSGGQGLVSWTSGNVGTITGVTGGTGLSGGGTSGIVTLNIVSTAAFTTSTQTFSAAQSFTSSETFSGAVLISTSVSLNGTVGTNGQIFTSAGPGAVATWTTPSAGASGIVSPGTFTWTNNFGIQASTLSLINTTSANTLTISTSSTGVNLVAVSSIPAILQSDFILTVSSLSAAVVFGVQNNSHVVSSGTAPSMGTCGSSPSVDGTDFSGVITVGGGVVTACTLNFTYPFARAPVCVASDNSTTVAVSLGTISTTAVTFNTPSTLGGGLIYYICVGNKG